MPVNPGAVRGALHRLRNVLGAEVDLDQADPDRPVAFAAGRLTVAPGQAVSSAWGNTLWDQSVNTFANAAARTTQWPTPLAGALSWLDDTRVLYVYSGGWNALPQGGNRHWTAGRAGASDSFANSAWVSMMSVALPASAPAGDYAVTTFLPIASNAAYVAYLRILAGAANLSGDPLMSGLAASQRHNWSWSGAFTHTGGAVTVQAQVQVSAGTGTVYNPPSRLDVSAI